jgi:hypothetical protein
MRGRAAVVAAILLPHGMGNAMAREETVTVSPSLELVLT